MHTYFDLHEAILKSQTKPPWEYNKDSESFPGQASLEIKVSFP